MGTRGLGIASATLREIVHRSSKAVRRRVASSKALVDACRLIAALEREERDKLQPRARR